MIVKFCFKFWGKKYDCLPYINTLNIPLNVNISYVLTNKNLYVNMCMKCFWNVQKYNYLDSFFQCIKKSYSYCQKVSNLGTYHSQQFNQCLFSLYLFCRFSILWIVQVCSTYQKNLKINVRLHISLISYVLMFGAFYGEIKCYVF